MKPGEPTQKRFVTIAVLAVMAAALAFGLGFRLLAGGVLAGAVLGLINYGLTRVTLRRLEQGPGPEAQWALVKRSLGRMGLSMAGLLAALPFGVEAVLGVLIGLLLEMTTYFLDLFTLAARRR